MTFRAAVDAIHAGDIAALSRLLDAEPGLLRERNLEPHAYPAAESFEYFRNAKLFWYVANNPILVDRMPENIVDVARAMIDRGVERADLDEALALTMSGSALREQGLARPLMQTLLAAGAVASREAVIVAAGHRELDAVRVLLENGISMDAPIAASLGDLALLEAALPAADPACVQLAFGLATLNGHLDAMRLAHAAGASVDLSLPVHAHATALHEAASRDDVAMIAFLIARGANASARDTKWDGTPLDWAIYLGNDAARKQLLT